MLRGRANYTALSWTERWSSPGVTPAPSDLHLPTICIPRPGTTLGVPGASCPLRVLWSLTKAARTGGGQPAASIYNLPCPARPPPRINVSPRSSVAVAVARSPSLPLRLNDR